VAATRSPADAYESITNGVPGSAMLAWDSALDEEERWDVAFYVWSLGAPGQAPEIGAPTYEERCAACHGADGAGAGTAMDLRSPRRADLSRQEQMERARAAHEAPFDGLDPLTASTTLEYVATFLYAPARSAGQTATAVP
jgi:mono/diheme cytochrome c family protein